MKWKIKVHQVQRKQIDRKYVQNDVHWYKHKQASMLAIGSAEHQLAIAPSHATHAADAVRAHHCHEHWTMVSYTLAKWKIRICLIAESIHSYFQLWQEAQLSPRDHASMLSLEILYNAAQMFKELHLKSPATGEWPLRPFKVTAVGAIW